MANCFRCGFEGAPHQKNGLNYCTGCFVKVNNEEKPKKKRDYFGWNKKKAAQEAQKQEAHTQTEEQLVKDNYKEYSLVWDSGTDKRAKTLMGKNIIEVKNEVRDRILKGAQGWEEEILADGSIQFSRARVPSDEEIQKFCAGVKETIIIRAAPKVVGEEK